LLRRSKRGPLKVNGNISTAAGRRAREFRRSAAMAAANRDQTTLMIAVAHVQLARLLYLPRRRGESARLARPAR